jgi:hypothetical protein
MMRYVLLLLCVFPLAAHAACVFHCESSDCSWEAVAPANCTQATPFQSQQDLELFATNLVAKEMLLDDVIETLKSQYFRCAPARRRSPQWDCGRVLKLNDLCSDHSVLVITPEIPAARQLDLNAELPGGVSDSKGQEKEQKVKTIHATYAYGCFSESGKK